MSEQALSNEEVDALLQGVGDGPASAEPGGGFEPDPATVQPYDLTSAERIARTPLGGFDSINEKFLRLLRAGLHGYIRRNVEVTVAPARFGKYREIVSTAGTPACISLLSAKPLRGAPFIMLAPELVYLVVDNLFGGDGRFPVRSDARGYTQAEQKIISRVVGVLCEAMTRAWEGIHPVQFAHQRNETNPQMLKTADDDDPVIVFTYAVTLGEVKGTFQFCLPFAVIEPVKQAFAAIPEEETSPVDKQWANLMSQQLQSASVEMAVNLGDARLTLGQIMGLQAGDIIPMRMEDIVTATVDGIPVLACTYGQVNGQYALRVERVLRPGADENG